MRDILASIPPWDHCSASHGLDDDRLSPAVPGRRGEAGDARRRLAMTCRDSSGSAGAAPALADVALLLPTVVMCREIATGLTAGGMKGG
jgi:hypothetical protein